MKRFLFSVCALAAVVVGCSKSEVLNRPNAEMPIEFNPYSGRIPETRAVAANIDTLGTYGFQVYAFMHKDGDECNYEATPYMNKVVTYDETANAGIGAWVYSGHAYWPATNLLNFVAYGLNAGAEEISKTEIKYTVPDDVAKQKDLLVAYNQVNAAYSDANEGIVNFNFSHLLSRIGFSLVTKDNNSVPVTIEQVNLVGKFYKEGNVRLTDGIETELKIGDKVVKTNRPYVDTKSLTAADVTYKLFGEGGSFTDKGSAAGTKIYDNSLLYTKNDLEGVDNDEYVENTAATQADKDKVAKNQESRYMMIIPAASTVHQAKLKVLYFLPGAGTFDEVVVDLSKVEFEAGKSYDFKLKVSTNGISFSVDVEAWDVTGEDREVIELN